MHSVWRCAVILSLCACSGLHLTLDKDGGPDAAGCAAAAQCPQPANSTAVCTSGVCSFACAQGFLHCATSCCTAKTIVAGALHTCVITSEDRVKCWGAAGAIGDEALDERNSPADVAGLTSTPVALTAGLVHTCARLDTGTVECWGLNTIGDGTNKLATKATPVSQLERVTSVASGGVHACAVADGGVKCWGTDVHGQQGTNGGGTRLSPGDVPGLLYDVVAVTSGDFHSCAVLKDGGVRCWGYNTAGECGDGTFQALKPAPVVATALDAGFVELQSGYAFNCARMVSGSVACWGNDTSGECGAGLAPGRALKAVNVIGITPGLTQLALGSMAMHACVVQDGGVWCWGLDDHGQLGDGNLGFQNKPVPVAGLTEAVKSVAIGSKHTCGITVSGAVYCWGSNSDGQLGDGTKGVDRLSPVLVR